MYLHPSIFYKKSNLLLYVQTIKTYNQQRYKRKTIIEIRLYERYIFNLHNQSYTLIFKINMQSTLIVNISFHISSYINYIRAEY